MKLANKLGLSTTLVALAVVLLLGFSISKIARRIAGDAIVDTQASTATHMMGDISAILGRARNDLQIIGADEFLERFFEPEGTSGNMFTSQAHLEVLVKEIEERARLTGPWLGVMAVRPDGVIAVSTLPDWTGHRIDELAEGARGFESALEDRPFQSDVTLFPHTGKPTVVLAAPIRGENNENVNGVVLAYFDWTAVSQVLDGSGPDSRAYLVDRDGRLIAARTGEDSRILKDRLTLAGLLTQPGEAVSRTTALAPHGEPVLATAVPGRRSSQPEVKDWTLILATPLAVAFAPVDAMTRDMLISVAAAMLVLVALFYGIGRALARPVTRLTEIVQSVAAGDLDARARTGSRDEVGALAAAFNRMTGELDAQRRELRANADFLEGIVNTSAGVIFAIGADGNFEFVNERGLAIMGYPAEEVLHQPFTKVFKPAQRRELLEEFAALRRGKSVTGRERQVVRKDGTPRWVEYSASPVTQDGAVVRAVGTAADVTERKRTEEKLRLASAVVESSPSILFRWRAAEDLPVEYVSKNVSRLGYSAAELVSGTVPYSALVHPEDLARVAEEVAQYAAAGVDAFTQEYRLVTRQGEVRWIDDRTAVERDAGGQISHYQGIVSDITDRKRAEEAIKASLAEKEALLREIHHRVKNNMQVVISLLNLEAGRITDPALLQVLHEAQRRIEVMAQVHEKLHHARDLAEVDARAYIGDIARSVLHSQVSRREAVRLTVDIDPLRLDLDAAIPCGLIVNELISNALKHAFPDGRQGEVKLVLHQTPEKALALTISDDGVGMPAGFDWRGMQTLGLRLVRNLAERQLQGRLDMDAANGTQWRITFEG